MAARASASDSSSSDGDRPILSDPKLPDDRFHEGIWGIGIPVACREGMNSYLLNSSEFDKIGSAAGTTIVTLIPALLSFAPLGMARVGHLIFFNTEIAMMTAAMTLGLLNKGVVTLAKDRLLKAKDLCENAPGPGRV
jgi:hypothetical protein